MHVLAYLQLFVKQALNNSYEISGRIRSVTSLGSMSAQTSNGLHGSEGNYATNRVVVNRSVVTKPALCNATYMSVDEQRYQVQYDVM